MPSCPGCLIRRAIASIGILDIHLVIGVDLDRDILAEHSRSAQSCAMPRGKPLNSKGSRPSTTG